MSVNPSVSQSESQRSIKWIACFFTHSIVIIIYIREYQFAHHTFHNVSSNSRLWITGDGAIHPSIHPDNVLFCGRRPSSVVVRRPSSLLLFAFCFLLFAFCFAVRWFVALSVSLLRCVVVCAVPLFFSSHLRVISCVLSPLDRNGRTDGRTDQSCGRQQRAVH